MLRLFCNYVRGINDKASVDEKPSHSSISEKLRSLRKFFVHIGLIFRLIFPRLCSASTALLFFLIVDVVGLEFIVYQVGLLGGKFYKALTDKDLNDFKNIAFLAIGN